MKAFIFSGQGTQKYSMGKDLYDLFDDARKLFNEANVILGRNITDIMFNGDELELSKTINAQPAIFVYQVVLSSIQDYIKPDIVCGHSLGEFAALVNSKSISFKQGLEIVNNRAKISQKVCDHSDSSMAAIIGFSDNILIELLNKFHKINQDKIYIANYNGPGQIVISGSKNGIKEVCKFLKEEGAKRAVILPISGGFHSPYVLNAEKELAEIIENYTIFAPAVPIIQSANCNINTNKETIKNNLKIHLTSPVNFTQMVHNAVKYGVDEFYEIGTDDTLQKIIKRMYPDLIVDSILNIPTYRNKITNFSIN
jgi:[acyl-carrier-protein] S-malonyltransferase